jgi:hypothetical protein
VAELRSAVGDVGFLTPKEHLFPMWNAYNIHHLPPARGGYLDQPPDILQDFGTLNLLETLLREELQDEAAIRRWEQQRQAAAQPRTYPVLELKDL